MENEQKKYEYPDGFFLKEIKPDFISVGIKWLDFITWAAEHHKTKDGWLNLYICKSQRTGKLYARWNDSAWRASTCTIDEPQNSDEGEEVIPF